jgi:hypothetical protein
MTVMKSVVLIPMVLLVPACASRPTAGASRCPLTSNDSVFAARGPVYRQCDVDKRARWINREAVRTNYRPPPPPVARRGSGTICYDGELEFVVDERGLPELETARVLRATDPEVGNAVLQSLPQWRFEPAQKGGTPVRQIVKERHIVGAMTVAVVVVRQGERPPVSSPGGPPTC